MFIYIRIYEELCQNCGGCNCWFPNLPEDGIVKDDTEKGYKIEKKYITCPVVRPYIDSFESYCMHDALEVIYES